MPIYHYGTVDVFAERPLSGNPVAVVLDAEGLSAEQMQALAAEFNYVETTFVLPAADPRHTARVRIFTPDREVPFAGHPNIGTAFLLAQERLRTTAELPGQFVFEEQAGLVAITFLREGHRLVGAELLSPQPLSLHATVAADQAAACLGLSPDDVRSDTHLPQVASVGLPFLLVELASRDALTRARPDRKAYDKLFPLDGARAVYAYVGEDGAAAECHLHSRMFTWRLVEDPGTGSATAAMTALLAHQSGRDVNLKVLQGEDMGRPSMIVTRSITEDACIRVYVSGPCATMFRGSFNLD